MLARFKIDTSQTRLSVFSLMAIKEVITFHSNLNQLLGMKDTDMNKKLYKFRPLLTRCNYKRVISIIRDGFYCCSFLDFNDVNEGVFPVTKNVNLGQKLEYRICSFSESEALSSELMWGHYAAAGMGVAIEIEANFENSESSFEKVHYGETNRHGNIREILTNKSSQWSYEKEYRYITTSQDKYLKCKITKIYYGAPYKKLENYYEIKEKHHKLKEYLRRVEALKKECTDSIPCVEYTQS